MSLLETVSASASLTASTNGGCWFWQSRRPWCCLSSLGGISKARTVRGVSYFKLKSAHCFCRWLPESARWLLANGKAAAAHRYIMECAEINGRTKCLENVTPDVYFSRHLQHATVADRRTAKKWRAGDLLSSQTLLEYAETECKDKKYTFVDLFKTPNIRKLSICIGLIWWVTP